MKSTMPASAITETPAIAAVLTASPDEGMLEAGATVNLVVTVALENLIVIVCSPSDNVLRYSGKIVIMTLPSAYVNWLISRILPSISI